MEHELANDFAGGGVGGSRGGCRRRLGGLVVAVTAFAAEDDRAEHEGHGEDGGATTEGQEEDEGLGKSHQGSLQRHRYTCDEQILALLADRPTCRSVPSGQADWPVGRLRWLTPPSARR